MIILALYQCLIEAYYKKHNIEEKIMKKIRTLLLSGLAILSLGLVATGVVSSEKNVSFEATYADSVSTYYSSITDSMTGETLLKALNSLNNTKRKRLVTYGGMRSFSAKCDKDPNGSNKILGFYDNKLVGPSWDSGNTWNREHVWPNIRGGNKVEDDAHMVRPASTSTNSDRGSKGYGMESYDPGQFVEYYRGSAARIIFYAAMADLSLGLVDNPLDFNGAGSFPNKMGSLSEMLKWNLQYLPTGTFTGANDIARRAEINRNNVIETDSSGQGNRNPFIDHPEYACRIWGNTNEKTKQVCSGQVIPPDVPPELESLTLSETTLSLTVGQTHTLTLTKTPSDAEMPEVFWGSNNKAVATVNNGVVTAVGNGTATIRVGTADAKFILSCEVTVTGGVAPANNHSGCGGNVATTSTIIATLSVLGIGMILLSRKTKKHE